MPSRDYHEALWSSVPEGLQPSSFELRRRFLIDALNPGVRLLDIGCGEGHFGASAAEAGAEVVAADVAEEPLRRARALHPGLDVRLIDGEGEWALDDAGFDVVWAGEVIEHVADTASWLSELRRVLRPGGRLILSTPLLGRRELLRAAVSGAVFAQRFEPRSDHLRHYNAATLRALLSDFGFEGIAVRYAGPRAERLLLASAVRSRF
ncbi:MAG TPA: methyltransferase domain-containing protein [Solirubrobacteraceae bacterium]|jgi:2-polyprenyl-3-methyl-5-hydroxy-6-metoxy-1,4-benzoquinol methylase|nr:methyltransferase domain-containing protein [Solirubrobacteraceae bacterium]